MIKYNEDIDSYLAELVLNHSRTYFKTIRAKDNKHILEYIEKCTPLLSDKYFKISTKVFWVINHIQKFPKCKICGKEIRKNIKINEGYPTHCCAKCLSHDPIVQMHKEESYQKRYGEGIVNPFQAKEVIDKITETNFKKYKVKRYTQSEDYRNGIRQHIKSINEKKYRTHIKNESFHISKDEGIVKHLIEKKYPNVKYHYKSERYPFECDFYIEELDLYVEYNGTWTHGRHPFDKNNEEDIEKLEQWKSKMSEYYDNAIYTWTDLDVRKRKTALENKLNHLELWNVDEVVKWLGFDNKNTLEYPYNRKKIHREFRYYRDVELESFPTLISYKNEIVKYFQQDVFFRVEKDIWRNNVIKRESLIQNRMKYLQKKEEELTAEDILTGFKKSGIHYGYSHFNPLIFKWFNEKYDVNSCYDPCGGWGHRLLGALNIEKYIYNDYSVNTKENVDRIIRYFSIKNTVTYNNDARTFNPYEKFDAMFTCPPYFNVEEYECGKFNDISDFNSFLDSLFDVFNKHIECNTFGLVITENLIGKHIDYSEKICFGCHGEKYLNGMSNKNEECLFIFEK